MFKRNILKNVSGNTSYHHKLKNKIKHATELKKKIISLSHVCLICFGYIVDAHVTLVT